MARNSRRSRDTTTSIVTVQQNQLVGYRGRYLASVEATRYGLQVVRKRDQGGRYDSHFFPWDRVVSYCEGKGGRRSPAFAIVMDIVTLLNVRGELHFEEDGAMYVEAIDRRTEEPYTVMITPREGTTVSVTTPAEKPEREDSDEPRPTRKAAAKAAPAARGKRREEPADEEFTDDFEAADDDADDAEDDDGFADDPSGEEVVDEDEPDEDGFEEDAAPPARTKPNLRLVKSDAVPKKGAAPQRGRQAAPAKGKGKPAPKPAPKPTRTPPAKGKAAPAKGKGKSTPSKGGKPKAKGATTKLSSDW